MTDLERRALLGDKEAQKECTEKGIVIPCPCCGGAVSTRVRPTKDSVTLSIICFDCGIKKSVIVEMLDAEFCKIENEINKFVNGWNTRPAPPVGRCDDCERQYENEDGVYICSHTETECEDDDYCSYFEPRCEE